MSVVGRGPRALELIAAIAVGALFGVGLMVSGMTDPARVVGFLQLDRGWDPSLAFVMAGAIAVNAPLLAWTRRRSGPLLGERFYLPTRRDLDAPLVIGAAVFGIGWGLGGLCPGPGVVAAGAGRGAALAFVAAMLIGMAGARAVIRAIVLARR